MSLRANVPKAIFILLAIFGIVFSPLSKASAYSDWVAGNIITNEIFTDSSSMTYDTIKQFLANKVPACDTYGTQTSEYGGGTRAQWAQAKYGQSTFTCLKDYKENGRDSAQIIYDVSRQYRINPKVLIVLLQKEQGLVTDTWPLNIQYRSATGYGCPDTAPCDSQYYGLTNQLTWSAKMFRAIVDASPTWYTPYLTGDNSLLYNPDSRCGSSRVSIQNRATQALYNYTPYQPNSATIQWKLGSGSSVSSAYPSCGAFGNINFMVYFENWFGAIRGDYCTTSLTQANTGVLFGKLANKRDQGIFTIYSGSATGCIESHVWNSGFGSWQSHTSTVSSSIDTNNSMLAYADLDGDGKDEGILIGLRNTGSGKIEFHVWDASQKKWKAHYISNSSTIDPSVSQVAFADLDGDGKDEGILMGVANGSTSTGKIEMHIWNPGFGTWKSHIITNSATMNPSVSQVAFADLDGDGKDEGILMGLRSGATSTGKIEFHVWNQGFGTWRDHNASNQTAAP